MAPFFWLAVCDSTFYLPNPLFFNSQTDRLCISLLVRLCMRAAKAAATVL
jgi:hypothetical protein